MFITAGEYNVEQSVTVRLFSSSSFFVLLSEIIPLLYKGYGEFPLNKPKVNPRVLEAAVSHLTVNASAQASVRENLKKTGLVAKGKRD